MREVCKIALSGNRTISFGRTGRLHGTEVSAPHAMTWTWTLISALVEDNMVSFIFIIIYMFRE